MTHRILLLLSLTLLTTACESSGLEAKTPAQPGQQHQLHQLERSDLRIETDSGLIHFRVYLVDTPEEMGIGLMHVSEMAKDAGMLFAYGRNRSASMWMKNTLIPLDILFIKRDGTIANIHKSTTPHSLKSLPSEGLVFGALEINAGLSDTLGIKAGDRVSHPIFQ